MIKTYLWVLGIVFLLVGVLGFVPNPLVGPGALFETDLMHTLVHLVSAGVFILTALYALESGALVMKVFGVVYLVVALLGFLMVPEGGELLGFIYMNTADHYLHVVLGVVILGLGLMGGKESGGQMRPMSSPSQSM